MRVEDHVLRQEIEIQTDLLTLSAGMRATDTSNLTGIMKLGRNPEGYFIEVHSCVKSTVC